MWLSSSLAHEEHAVIYFFVLFLYIHLYVCLYIKLLLILLLDCIILEGMPEEDQTGQEMKSWLIR